MTGIYAEQAYTCLRMKDRARVLPHQKNYDL